MLTREISISWLPEDIFKGDAGRRLDIILAGVFWDTSQPPSGPPPPLAPNLPRFHEYFIPWKTDPPQGSTSPPPSPVQITGWRIYYIPIAGGHPVPGPAVPNETQNLDANYSDDAITIAAQYTADIEDACWDKTSNAVKAAAVSSDTPQQSTTSLDVSDAAAPSPNGVAGWLRAYIGSQATALPPLNHMLNLAWITQPIPLKDGGTDNWNIVAFPVFVAGGDWEGEPAQATIQVDRAENGFVRARYPGKNGAPDLQVICRRRPATPPAAPPTQKTPLQLEQLDVADTAEWLSDLCSNAAPVFDFAQWLVDWLKVIVTPTAEDSAEATIRRELVTKADDSDSKKKAEVASFLKQLSDYLFVAIHDLCGIGYLEAPDGTGLAKTIWETADETTRRRLPYDQLLADLKAWDQKQAAPNLPLFINWFLLQSINSTNPGSVLKAVFSRAELGDPTEGLLLGEISSSHVLDYIQKLCALIDSIREPENARLIIAEQWSRFFQDSKSEPLPVTAALSAIQDPVRFQARSIMRIEPAGIQPPESYWHILFRSISPPKDENRMQRDIVTNLEQCVTDPVFGAWQQRFSSRQQDFWPPLKPTDNPLVQPFGATDLEQAFKNFIGSVFQWGDHWTSTTLEPPPPPKNIPDVLFPHQKDTYPRQPSVRAQVFRIDADDKGKPGDDNTDDRAGIVLYCRRDDAKSWASLNRVQVDIRDKTGEVTQSLTKTYVIPSPISGQDGLRHSFRRFDNENLSIIASPDIHNKAPSAPGEPTPLRAISYSVRFEEKRRDDQPGYKHRACSLHYGKQYQVAGAWITNAGVLPTALRANTDDPKSLVIPNNDPPDLRDLAANNHYLHQRRVPVGPIRLDRPDRKKNEPLFPIPGTGQADAQKTSPGGVRPLACELPEWSQPKQQTNEKILTCSDQSLLLIFSDRASTGSLIQNALFGSVVCTIRKPTAPFWDWFAWHDEWDDKWKQIRKDEWYWETCVRNFAVDRATGPGPLDDPAVQDSLYCEVEELFPQRKTYTSIFFKYFDSTDRPLRAPAFQLTVKIVGRDKPFTPPKSSAGAVTIEIPQGHIVRLRLFSLVDAGEFTAQGRFHDFMQALPGYRKIDGTNLIGVSPVELWIEAARDWDDRELQDGLTKNLWPAFRLESPYAFDLRLLDNPPDSIPQSGRRQVCIATTNGKFHFRVFDRNGVDVVDVTEDSLSASAKAKLETLRGDLDSLSHQQQSISSSQIIAEVFAITGWQPDRTIRAFIDRNQDAENFAQAGRLDVWHQIWRWDGRDVDADLLGQMLHEPEANRDVADLQKHNSHSIVWDGAAFGLRPDYSHRSTSAKLSAYRDPQGESLQEIFADDLSDDPRALYYRIAVQAFSRYEGVFGSKPVLAVTTLPTQLGKQPILAPWRRALVKASPTEKISKPAVRAALPLTRDVVLRDEPPLNAASVMLVLDNIPYADGGLAQQLDIGIAVVNNPTAKRETYYQAGFDVTLTATALAKAPSQNSNGVSMNPNQQTGKRPTLGPYGLTYDYAAKIPKLRGCCFICRIPLNIAAPEGGGEGTLDGKLPWFLCQIHARWVLRPEAVYCTNGGTADQFTSEWSAPMWIQFLPNTDVLLPPAWRDPCTRKPIKLPITPDQGKGPPWLCTVEDIRAFDDEFETQFERWLVLSERIFDIKGQPTERYCGTFVQDGPLKNPRFVSSEQTIPADIGKVQRAGYLRLVLVRRPTVPEQTADANSRRRDPWKDLFSSHEDPAQVTVMDDATCGAPVVTSRIAVIF